MVQISLALLISALVLVTAAPSPNILELHRREDGHVVSDSSEESNESQPLRTAPETWSSAESSHSRSSESAEVRRGAQQDHANLIEYPASHHSTETGLHPGLEKEVEGHKASSSDGDAEESEAERAHLVRTGSSWEHRYKQGVVPAKLPAQEKDNGYRYRHSIIHGYGDDVHA